MINKKPTPELDENGDFVDGVSFSPVYSVVCTYADGNATRHTVKTLHIEKDIREMIDIDSKTCNMLLSAVALRVNSKVIDSVAAVRNYKDTATWYFTTKRYIKGTPLKQNSRPSISKGCI